MTEGIFTRCNDCVFRHENSEGIQDGCTVGRLETFREINTDMVFDEETKSYIINRTCNTKRLKGWAENKVNKEEAVMAETKLKVDVVLVVPNDKMYKPVAAAVCRTLKQCIKQTQKPNSIIIITSNTEVESNIQSFWNDVVNATLKDSDIKYSMVRITDGIRTLSMMIDECVKKCKGQYYCVLEAGDKIEPDAIEKLDYMINTEMKQILCIVPTHLSSGYPAMIQRTIHNMLGGNGYGDIVSKIKEKTEEQSKQHMVAQWVIL